MARLPSTSRGASSTASGSCRRGASGGPPGARPARGAPRLLGRLPHRRVVPRRAQGRKTRTAEVTFRFRGRGGSCYSGTASADPNLKPSATRIRSCDPCSPARGWRWRCSCGPGPRRPTRNPAAAGPPAGHTRVLEAQRVAEAPAIDGRLVEAAWQHGAAAEGFWVSEWRQAPTDQTRVVVLYDDTTLYVAFTCLDARPEMVRATQLTRDASPGVDDRVTVELDPRHAHRSVSRFTVTARGTQSDAIAGRTGRRLQGQMDRGGAAHADRLDGGVRHPVRDARPRPRDRHDRR